jgi:hypothetical protein
MRNEHSADEARIDLSALDPDRDPAAADRFVAGVMGRVATRPVPSAMPADPLIGIWSMLRSPAIAAGVIIAVAVGALGVRMNRADESPRNVAQAIGVPVEFLDNAPPAIVPDSR